MEVRHDKICVVQLPRANSIGESSLTDPRNMVPIQLKNLIPVGTEMSRVSTVKKGSSTAPVVYMWCAQTPIDRPPIDRVAKTMPL
jgi:hypothetical protein